MTIPANDAFTFGLAHDSNTTPSLSRRTSHPRLPARSPSPKTAFSSTLATPPLKPTMSANVPTRRTRRTSTNGGTVTPSSVPNKVAATKVTANGIANGNGHVHADIEEEDERNVDELLNERGNALSAPTRARKIDWEVPRKVLHASIGFFTLPLYTYHIPPRAVVAVLGTTLMTVVGPADIIRFRYPTFAKTYERYLGFLMRESEKTKTNGVIWYLIGAMFSLSAYPADIAVVSILILSWADTTASTFGRLWGPYTAPLPTHLSLPLFPSIRVPTLFARRKSVAGFIAASLTGALIAFGFFGWVAPMGSDMPSWTWGGGVGPTTSMGLIADTIRERVGAAGVSTGGWLGLAALSVFTGLVTGIAEALNLGELDDNLTLPIISGGCIFGLFKLFQLISS